MLNTHRPKAGILARLLPVAAVIAALFIGCLIIILLGLDPIKAMEGLFKGAFGDAASWGETVVKMTPLIFTGLSFALASRCGLTNIGAEGQLYMGGLCAMAVGLYVKGLPALVHLPLAVVAGFLAGGCWGALAGWLKCRFRMNEIISTIMLNYIANYLVNYMVTVVMVEPPGNAPRTAVVGLSAQFPRILEGSRMHWGVLLACLTIVFYWFFLSKTKSGFETRVVGLNADAAAYAGIDRKRKTLLAMFLAGGFAGLAGVTELLGVQLRMYQNFSSGYGFDGIAVALLGQNTPLGVLISAFLFGALRAGSNLMQMSAKVPSALISVIQALVILFVVGSGRFRFRRSGRRADKTGRKEGSA